MDGRIGEVMCGIVGVVGIPVSDLALNAAMTSLRHRGPDGRGTYRDDDCLVALAHTRLAIIDLNTGQQPIVSHDGQLAVVCNGELYDHERIRAELRAKGHRFKTQSDSEILLYLYREYGTDFHTHLRGEFAFLLFDKSKRKIFAMRDRFGIKPLFWAQTTSGAYVFASEAKAIFATSLINPALNRVAVRDSLYCKFGLTPNPVSIFEGVDVVPPGCFMEVDLHSLSSKTVQYWDLDFPERGQVTGDGFSKSMQDDFANVLDEAIRLRLRSDVPVGVFLSGGLDSCFIAASMARHHPDPFAALTISFPQAKGFDELPHAKAMAAHLGLHQDITIADDDSLLRNLAACLWHTESPQVSLSGVGKYLLSRMTSKHVKVVITGEGADELLLGYLDPLGLPTRLLSRAVRTLLPLLFETRVRREPILEFASIIPPEQGKNRHHLHQYQYGAYRSNLARFILVVLGDRVEMANSVEARVPFLDHHVFDVAKRLPNDVKYRKGITKAILRDIAKGIMPDELVTRKKQQYQAPPPPVREGMSPVMDTLIDEFLSAKIIEDVGVFSPLTISALRSVCRTPGGSSSGIKWFANWALHFVLATHILHSSFVDNQGLLHVDVDSRDSPKSVSDDRASLN
ncbi:MAG: asparagine synthase (glutamine-hydrolyzing) [Deltaproteobacteria bacterium RIFOXYA12_FULL_58_15]|nr:MAG: asparagine synthase (glutamine-hydrolyzing) [Deltaproteobacteria bacterium RIFOXYA12_FULL_58_15]OGR09567.1 MAG: asparagine synthase (glutamine-hydrolyzing) [Deltaproteobacteria bacterium RIFOXYB12_FULL_58_9]